MPEPRRGGVRSQALPGVPRFARPGKPTRTPGRAYCQSWSLLGLGWLGESAWTFPADGGVHGVGLNDRYPSGPRPSLTPGQRYGFEELRTFSRQECSPRVSTLAGGGGLWQLFI